MKNLLSDKWKLVMITMIVFVAIAVHFSFDTNDAWSPKPMFYWFVMFFPMVAVGIYIVIGIFSQLTQGTLDQTSRNKIRAATLPMALKESLVIVIISASCTIAQFLFYLTGWPMEIDWIERFVYGREEILSVLLVLIYSLSFISTLTMLHFWTIYCAETVSNRLIDRQASRCAYCSSSAHAICSECDSIQWPKMSMLHGIGLYLAHHRAHVIAGALTIGFIGPISFHYTRYYDQVNKKLEVLHEYEEDASRLMNATLSIRSFIHTHSEYDNSNLSNRSIANQDFLERRDLDSLVMHFYEVTWFGSRVIDYLRCTKCNDIWRHNNHLPELDQSDHLVQKACEVIKQNGKFYREVVGETEKTMFTVDSVFMYELDLAFVSYLNSLQRDDISKEEAEFAAERIFSRLKALDCIIAELTFNHNTDFLRSKSWYHPELENRITENYAMNKIYDCRHCLDSYAKTGIPAEGEVKIPFERRNGKDTDYDLNATPADSTGRLGQISEK